MQRQIQNTTEDFQKTPRLRRLLVLASAVILILLAGLVVSIIRNRLLEAAIFAIGTTGFAVFGIWSHSALRGLRSTVTNRAIDWFAAMPDEQRQHLNIEVRELSKVLETEPEQIGDLQSAYVVAEDLALRQIQHEEGVPLLRHISVAGVPFDAVYSKDGFLVCCEVAFLVAPELRADRTDSMIRKISSVAAALANETADVRLMIILVTQLAEDDERALRTALNKRKFSETPVDIDIRLLDFEALQRMYVTDQVDI